MNIQHTITPSEAETGYDTDFLAWTEAQADALRARDLSRIDWTNLIEEVESLGKSQRKELLSRITIILVHLLKHEHGLDRRPSAKWRTTLLTQRDDLSQLLQDNPSLMREVAGAIDQKYPMARVRALFELQEHKPERSSDYDALFPATVPYNAEQVLDFEFFPIASQN